MKLLAGILLLFVTSTHAELVRMSEPVAADANSETFGAELNQSLTKVSLKQLLNSPERFLEEPFLLTTQISKVCQKKGCFFIAKEDHLAIRVAFKDYGFFIPNDSGNKVVELNGSLLQKQLSKKQADHFNQDIKAKDPAIKAGKQYEIVATSVKIPKAQS